MEIIIKKAEMYRIKADQFTYTWNHKVRDVAPDPAVNRTGQIDNPTYFVRADLTSKWQFFWADLLSMRVYGKLFNELDGADHEMIVDIFNVLSEGDTFLTNKAGTDTKNNYIDGNDNRGEDPKVDPLVCAGSPVMVRETKLSTSGATNGLIMARLASFRDTETPPVVTQDVLDNDPRILRAMVIGAAGDLKDFPQLYNRRETLWWLTEFWVPYPYISKADSWFPLRDMEKI